MSEPKRYAPDFPPGLPCDEFPICHQSLWWDGFAYGLDDDDGRVPEPEAYAARRAYEDAWYPEVYGKD